MIRIVQNYDCDLLAHLNNEVQEHHHLLYPEIFKPFNHPETSNFYRSALGGGALAFVAYWLEQPVGYILLIKKETAENAFQNSQKFLLIDQIGVSRSYRNKGIASALIKKAEEIAGAAQIHSVRLNHWSQNDSAKMLFKKNGFSYINENMQKLISFSE